jgi:ketosteroid isomerase-like protein
MTADTHPQVDEVAFTELAERYRPEMRIHCYRMLGSFEDSEDAVQETLLRAWRRRDTFAGAPPSGPGCTGSPRMPAWTRSGAGTAACRLPPVPRFHGSSRSPTACSRSSPRTTSTRTRRSSPPERRLEWAPGADASEEEEALLARYLNATEEADAEAFVEMMREDARFSMPPEPGLWVGRRTIVDAWSEGFDTDSFGRMRGVVTRANMQPAVACYLKRPGETTYRPMALDVIRIEEGRIAEIVTFPPQVFPAFALPDEL